jgi:hypothetical protein
MSDFWSEAAAQEVAEPPKSTFEGLPDGAIVIVKTATSTDKETVHPKIKPITYKDKVTGEDKEFYKLKVPMQVIGGDSKILPKHVGKGWLFPEFNIEAPTAEQLEKRIASADANGWESTASRLRGMLKSLDKFPCDPELYNLILDCMTPKGPTTQARWQEAATALTTTAEEAGLTIESCHGNSQYLFAAAFHACLMAREYTVVGKLFTPKKKEGSQYDPQQTVGSIGSYTDAEAKRRKVKMIEPEAKDDF